MVSQPEISGCVDRTSAVSQLYRHLIGKGNGCLGIVQVQLNLNKLSADAAAEHSSSLLKDCTDSDTEFVCCIQRGSQTE